ncbi:MAG TPA: hypothetical protein DCZ71_04660 [Ruminococcus sp.]|nr:hypothetical protein [Ruminococcus sp.]
MNGSRSIGGGSRKLYHHDPDTGGGGSTKKSVDKSSDDGVQYGKEEIKNDFDGKPYTYPELHLPKKEYGTVIRQIDDNYESKYKGKSIGFHSTSKYTYKFEIRGYNDYNIFSKWKND